MSIVSPKAVQDYGEDFGRHPVGSGPFRLKEWVSGQRIVLERNESYWGTHAKPFQVIYAPVKEAATRASMLETAQADIIENILPADAKRLSSNQDMQIIKLEALEVSQIRFNMLDEKFKDVRVRQALN